MLKKEILMNTPVFPFFNFFFSPLSSNFHLSWINESDLLMVDFFQIWKKLLVLFQLFLFYFEDKNAVGQNFFGKITPKTYKHKLLHEFSIALLLTLLHDLLWLNTPLKSDSILFLNNMLHSKAMLINCYNNYFNWHLIYCFDFMT